AGERPRGQPNAGQELHVACVVAGDVEERLRELLGQQAEAGDDAGPAPARFLEVEELDDESVARFGPVDMNWAGHRVHLREVEAADVGRGGALRELPAGGVDGLELEDLPRLGAQRRPE